MDRKSKPTTQIMSTTKSKTIAKVEGEEIEISIDSIQPSRFQQRTFDKQSKVSLESLAADIKANGVMQRPIVIKVGAKYELVFGERRTRAGKLAGLKMMPVILVDWNEERIRKAHYSENLQREDLHSLDQAATLQDWKQSEVPEMTTRELALQSGMSERETARALALMNLIEPAQEMFRANKIYRGHADQIARLSPEVQQRALEQCFEQEGRWNASAGEYQYKPLYDQLRSVTQLSKWIDENLIQDLDHAPWDLTDATLVPSQGPCSTCQFNTAANAILFDDAPPKAAICTNAEGFQRKMMAFVERQIETVATKEKEQKPLVLSTLHSHHNIKKDHATWYERLGKAGTPVLLSEQYYDASGRNKCTYARTAVFVNGKNVGQLTKVCIEERCPSHSGRRVSSSTSSRSATRSVKTPAEREKFNRRKQELFDLKVAEQTRKSIFLQVAKQMNDKLDRTWRERMAAEAFLRLPAFDAQTVQEVLIAVTEQTKGEDVATVSDLPTSHYDVDRLMAKVKKFSERQLGRLLHLCAFGHYGANQYLDKPVNQHPVISLAKEREVDYRLADAQVRALMSSKKYQKPHDEYLEAVLAGRKAAIPHVYDTQKADAPPKGGKASEKAKKRTARPKK